MYHTCIILDGRLCHQLLVCGYIVSLAVFVLSFVKLFLILSQGHFGENDLFRPSSARCLHPFLSQATCERTLPLSHFFCLRPYSIDSSYHRYWLYLHPLLNRCTPNISPLLPSLLTDMPPRKKPVPPLTKGGTQGAAGKVSTRALLSSTTADDFNSVADDDVDDDDDSTTGDDLDDDGFCRNGRQQ